MSDFKILYITCSNKDEARKLSELCLKENLIACANVFPEIESIYKWEGKTESQLESVVIFKTHASKLEAAKKLVIDNHSYDCPCILCFDIESLNDAFASFLSQQTLSC